MNIISYPEFESWARILQRPELNYSTLEEQTRKIIEDVAANGDLAVRRYTKEFDGVNPESHEVSSKEMQDAGLLVSTTGGRADCRSPFWRDRSPGSSRIWPRSYAFALGQREISSR